jgi:hypothetical protein
VNGRLEGLRRPGAFIFQKLSHLPAQGCVIRSDPFDRPLVDHYFFPKITQSSICQFPVLPIFVPLIREESKEYPNSDQGHFYQQFEDRL